jgi:excisionase family DNA binding protein
MSNLMTLKEAAPKLRISAITLRRMAAKKDIPFHRVGSKYLFTDGDIEEYLKSCEVPAKQLRDDGGTL